MRSFLVGWEVGHSDTWVICSGVSPLWTILKATFWFLYFPSYTLAWTPSPILGPTNGSLGSTNHLAFNWTPPTHRTHSQILIPPQINSWINIYSLAKTLVFITHLKQTNYKKNCEIVEYRKTCTAWFYRPISFPKILKRKKNWDMFLLRKQRIKPHMFQIHPLKIP